MHNHDEDDDTHSDDVWAEVGRIKARAQAEAKASRLWHDSRLESSETFKRMKQKYQAEVIQRVNRYVITETDLALLWSDEAACFKVVFKRELPETQHTPAH